MPKKVALALFLMVFISLSEGVGLLLLIPLLQLVGLEVGSGTPDQIATIVSSVLGFLGLQTTLPTVLAIYITVISISALLYRWKTLLTYDIQYVFAAHLRKRLYKAITNSDWIFFIKKKSSDYVHALTNEIERIGIGTNQFLSFLASIMILAVYIIFSIKLIGITTGLIFVLGLLLLLILKKKVKSSHSSGKGVTRATRDLYASITQHLDGMKTIKSFGLQEDNTKIFADETYRVIHQYLASIRSYADVKLLFEVGSVIFLALMVLLLIEVINVPTASILVLIYIFVRMIPQFSIIQYSYQYFLNMLPALDNVMALEKECLKHVEYEEIGTKEIEFEKEIVLDNVSFSYGDHFQIEGLNLTISAGESVAIVGSSGAGKSTLVDLIMGLIKPESGKVMIDELSITNMPSWRNKIGYVSQDTFLFNETVRFNLTLARPDATEEEIKTALKLASANNFVSKLPEGLDTLIGDRGVRLSGGEKQRLALARAMIRQPKLLILDEATSNLDSKNEKRILRAIEDLPENITIISVAHRLSTIKNADYIYVMDKGSIKESGKWDDLIKDETGIFRHLCDVQGL